MRRFFGKSTTKSESEVRDLEEGHVSDSDLEESKKTPEPKTKRKSEKERHSNHDLDDGDGDAGKSSRANKTKSTHANESGDAVSKPPRDERRHKTKSKLFDEDPTDEIPNPKTKPRPKPRQRTTIAEPLGPSPVAEFSESERVADTTKDGDEGHSLVDPEPQSRSPSPPRKHQKQKETKERKAKQKEKRQSSTAHARGSDFTNDSAEEITEFIKKEDLPPLPRIESGKGVHFMSSAYSYRKPISSFSVRARLLKYPTLTDLGVWPGDMAVIDDRVFQWQEKVFSKSEAKRLQKLHNCVTEQDRRYHEEVLNNPDSIGKSLYSYVSDDPYVLKKNLKLLMRRCPVEHIRKGKGIIRLSSSGKAIDSDGESIEDDYLSEGLSIDLEEPLSSSTPKTKRKTADKTKESLEMAKVEKKVRENKEKELKNLERRNVKLKRLEAKRKYDDMKRTKQEESKAEERIKKAEAFEDEERSRRQDYIKKYQHYHRPSLPIGARFRPVRMSPGMGKKHKEKRKGHLAPETSSDYLDNEAKDNLEGEDGHGESESNGQGHKHKAEKLKITKKIGHEHSDHYDDDVKRTASFKAVSPKAGKKFLERFSFRNAQTMYIMASVPYSPGRSREIVVSMIRNIPRQGIVMFKPALGYRNIEAKRNHVFRVSCELTSSSEAKSAALAPKSHTHQKRKPSGSVKFTAPSSGEYRVGGLFELAPKNEMRLTVMGEITTAEGFESSPLNIYYLVDIPKGWRNDSILNHTEGITHTCYTNDQSVAHYSHEFSFHLVFSMDVLENSETFPTPTISLLVVSMDSPSPRIIYEGYGYVNVPMSPGTHFVKIKMWKPRPRTTVEKLQAAFLNITPSLQDIKFVHMPYSEDEGGKKANLLGFQTVPTGTVKLRFNVIHQMPITFNKGHSTKLDLLEKMSSSTILKSVQAVIEAFQRARQKAANVKSQYP